MQNDFTAKSNEIFEMLNSPSKELDYIAKQWALEQIKNISNPKEAYQKFTELHQVFIKANS